MHPHSGCGCDEHPALHGGRAPPSKEPRDVRSGVHPAHGGGLHRVRTGREGGRATVTVENGIGLALAVVLVAFLVAALLFPERF
nr:K(+)-transporting ATPase subunit F [Actinomadura citrea]